MELFGDDHPRLTIKEISERLDMPKTTVFNILNTLQTQGYIEKLENAEYALGSSIISLGQKARVNIEVRDRAAPLLRELANRVRESIYLTVRDGDFSLYIYAIESSQRLMARTAMGDRVHMHCTGVGKATLAFLPHETVQEIVGRVGLPKRTDNTIIDMSRLQEELQVTRKRGYSIDNCEIEPNTFCVGAPIFDAHGKVIGSCSISGNHPDIVGIQRDDFADAIMRVAEEISRRIGYVPVRATRLQTTNNRH
ncbi:MAG: IclR family transcriptional regulator [Anaerolineae bacterium]|nr:IclR family transcriptional regulator [Anaerolineae bacterium]